MRIREDSTARWFAGSAVFWLVLSISWGIVQAMQFVSPDMTTGVSWLVFPRIRQFHVNGLAFGWLSMGMIAAWYYIVPRLTGAKLHSEKLGVFSAIAWNVALAVGTTGFLFGWTQAREYAELAWPVDIGVLALLLLTGYNLLRTIVVRENESLYVSLWYIMGSLIWFPIVFSIGNVIWAPPEGALMGLNDAIWGWFYGHNILGLWFTTGTVGIIYYILPKEVRRPLYGYSLALIAFWFLAFFYTAVGTHHILQAPVPEWLKAISVVTSVGLLIPVSAFIINMFMTMRGSWRDLHYSLPLRFIMSGVAFYGAVSLQGSTQALRHFNQFIHFTNWSVAHAHLALLGFVAFSLWGAFYFLVPRLWDHPLYSERLAWLHWWLTFIGFIGFFSVLTAAGLVQAGNFKEGVPVVQVLPGVMPLWIGRAAFGSMIIAAQYVFAFNIYKTTKGERAAAEIPEPAAPADEIVAVPEPVAE